MGNIKTHFLKVQKADGRKPVYYNSQGYWSTVELLNSDDLYGDLEAEIKSLKKDKELLIFNINKSESKLTIVGRLLNRALEAIRDYENEGYCPHEIFDSPEYQAYLKTKESKNV